MRDVLKRLVVVLATGYVFVYYGEMVFWATPDRPGMGPVGLIATWLVYSVFAYAFLGVVSLFKVRSIWAVLLAGAFYGWFEEGIILQTTYGTPDTPFPMSISFTALAWHAPLDVFVGWYLVRRALATGKITYTLALACGIGVFYGLWAIFWWTEPPELMKALFDAGRRDLVLRHFAAFAWLTTAGLIVAHWLFDRCRPSVFRPAKIELALLGVATALYFFFVTVVTVPRALWVMPPLLGLTLLALLKNRSVERRSDAIVAFAPPARAYHYLALFAIPLVATAIYFVALTAGATLRTNIPIYYVSTGLGVLLWLLSLAMSFCRRT